LVFNYVNATTVGVKNMRLSDMFGIILFVVIGLGFGGLAILACRLAINEFKEKDYTGVFSIGVIALILGLIGLIILSATYEVAFK
jgi:H+/Cl- antiporter ClcA